MKVLKLLALIVCLGIGLFVTGCGKEQPKETPAIKVNSYQVSKGDTIVSQEFSGSVTSQQKVPVRAKVTGYLTEKFVHGGQVVTEGQPLYKIDGRTYASALAAAEATAAQAGVMAENAQVDLKRYEVLAANNAVAQQVYDAQKARAAQSQEAYNATLAQVQIARDNMNDTIIRAPFSGTLGMDDIAVGTFVAAGQTPLVTLQSNGPVYVDFSMSEAAYLSLSKMAPNGKLQDINNIKLRFNDGTIYSHLGQIVEVSKSLDSGSGQIQAKVKFDNPEGVLIPGMFATLIMPGQDMKNVTLIPSKAIVQILDKYFVMVIDKDNKIKQVPIELGASQGQFTVVTKGLNDGDVIVVDGLTKVKPGITVNPTALTKEDVSKDK